MKKTLLILFACCATIMFMSCEGPMGLPGADGADGLDGSDGTPGVDGNVTCLTCHSTGTIQGINEQFQQSVHYSGHVAVDYAGARASCARCHSSEGFIEFATNGSVGENISAPSAWECKTCHTIHETFEETNFASILRLADPISFIFDTTVIADFGNSNLCANCHQQRRAEPNAASPGTTFEITSSHYGPHYGVQSNVLYGVGLAEIAGSMSYQTAGSGIHMAGKCTGCHMATYGNGQGGHTWNPALDACNSCHGASETNFDYGGVQTTVQVQLDEIRDTLLARGVIEFESGDYYELNEETGVIELVTAAGGYHPVEGTYPMGDVQAFFNWKGLKDDRSLGVHNPKYVKAILTNTLEALKAPK